MMFSTAVRFYSDVNECADSTSDCASTSQCVNEEGGWTCECRTGYEGDPRLGCSGVRKKLDIFWELNVSSRQCELKPSLLWQLPELFWLPVEILFFCFGFYNLNSYHTQGRTFSCRIAVWCNFILYNFLHLRLNGCDSSTFSWFYLFVIIACLSTYHHTTDLKFVVSSLYDIRLNFVF